jgi:hypothetical protein
MTRRLDVVTSSAPRAQPGFANPLVAVNRLGKIVDGKYYLDQLDIDHRGIIGIKAVAVLFLAWAHTQAGLARGRTTWPGRSYASIAAWASTQPWVAHGGALGANGVLVARKATENYYIEPHLVVKTATPKFRAYVLASLAHSVPYIMAGIYGISRAQACTNFLQPELALLSGKVAKNYWAEGGISTSHTGRASPGGVAQWMASTRTRLVYDGYAEDNASSDAHKRMRIGPIIAYDFEACTSPFAYVLSNECYRGFSRRALYAANYVINGNIEVTLKPMVEASTDRGARSVLDATPLKGTAFCDGEFVTWAHIYFWHICCNVKAVTISGCTKAAIEANHDGAHGGTWLDLLAMPTTIIKRQLLKATEAATAPALRAAVAEDTVLQKYGGLPAAQHVSICSPATKRPAPITAYAQAFDLQSVQQAHKRPRVVSPTPSVPHEA